MSEYLPWTKGMEMIEKGRKEKGHDLLEMWCATKVHTHPATLFLLPMSSTSNSETLSFCLLTSKCTLPLISARIFVRCFNDVLRRKINLQLEQPGKVPSTEEFLVGKSSLCCKVKHKVDTRELPAAAGSECSARQEKAGKTKSDNFHVQS